MNTSRACYGMRGEASNRGTFMFFSNGIIYITNIVHVVFTCMFVIPDTSLISVVKLIIVQTCTMYKCSAKIFELKSQSWTN